NWDFISGQLAMVGTVFRCGVSDPCHVSGDATGSSLGSPAVAERKYLGRSGSMSRLTPNFSLSPSMALLYLWTCEKTTPSYPAAAISTRVAFFMVIPIP